MARRDEIDAQIKALQDEAAAIDDGEHEVWIESDDEPGKRYRVSGGHAKGVLQRLGLLPSDDGDDGDEGQADDDKTTGPGKTGKKPTPDAKPERKGYLK